MTRSDRRFSAALYDMRASFSSKTSATLSSIRRRSQSYTPSSTSPLSQTSDQEASGSDHSSSKRWSALVFRPKAVERRRSSEVTITPSQISLSTRLSTSSPPSSSSTLVEDPRLSSYKQHQIQEEEASTWTLHMKSGFAGTYGYPVEDTLDSLFDPFEQYPRSAWSDSETESDDSEAGDDEEDSDVEAEVFMTPRSSTDDFETQLSAMIFDYSVESLVDPHRFGAPRLATPSSRYPPRSSSLATFRTKARSERPEVRRMER